MRILAVIPSRFAAVRFPGKPLALIHGRPMLEWVHLHAKMARHIDRLIIATDDARIEELAKNISAEVVITSSHCQSGTDRVFEAFNIVNESGPFDWILNIQGDEPALHPNTIDNLIEFASRNTFFDIITASCPFFNTQDIRNPNIVKVVADKQRKALYFSRSVIPYMPEQMDNKQLSTNLLTNYERHLGLYLYRPTALSKFATLEIDPIEKVERLEQLRALRSGMTIGVCSAEYPSIGVDSPEDIHAAEKMLIDNKLFKG